MRVLKNEGDKTISLELSGPLSELRELSKCFLNPPKNKQITLVQKANKFYPSALAAIEIKLDGDAVSNRVAIKCTGETLSIQGSGKALAKLGESISNVFGENCVVAENEHIHLDYFEGNDLIEPTNCDLIIISRG